jgi:hypothetical protein
MQEKHLYEYAVIRVVPRVEREEFMNVGVILYCSGQRYLATKFAVQPHRLISFAPAIDLVEIEAYLLALEKVCGGGRDAGTIGLLPLASRFRWLTATRSTVIQSSKVHSGFSSDPRQTLQHLFDQLVG